MGQMIVATNFNMVGVLRVDGRNLAAGTNALQVNPTLTFQMIYDDQINRQIPVSPYELQVDSFTAVAL